jgi:hypothetical protein
VTAADVVPEVLELDVPEPDWDPVDPMFGQWCVDVLPLLADPLELLEDPLEPLDVEDPPDELDEPDDVVLVALAVVAAWLDDVVVGELAPATSMLAPRPSPNAPATTPAATIGCRSFIRCSFHSSPDPGVPAPEGPMPPSVK